MPDYLCAGSLITNTSDFSDAYHKGWARDGEIRGEHYKYGLLLDMNHNGAEEYGGPLFWEHYSFLGLDPRNLKDEYSDYWTHNVNQSMINYKYCVENPLRYKGYGENCWGLTASTPSMVTLPTVHQMTWGLSPLQQRFPAFLTHRRNR